MRWITEVLSFSFEGGLARAHITEDSLMLVDGKVFSAAFIELMGQAYGYIMGAAAADQNQKLALAYLAAIDDVEFFSNPTIVAGMDLEVSVATLTALHPLYIVKAVVKHKNQPICQGQIKCYAEFEERNL